MMDSPVDNSGRVNLDQPPPPPAPDTEPPAQSLSSLAGTPEQAGGDALTSPQATALQSVMQIENNIRILSTLLPGLAPIVGELVARLRETVPRLLSEATQGAQAGIPQNILSVLGGLGGIGQMQQQSPTQTAPQSPQLGPPPQMAG